MSKVNGEKYRAAPQGLVERILARPYDTNADGCRLWKGRLGKDGYGIAKYRAGDGRELVVAVHRLVYVRLIDDPGDDAEIDHACHDPLVCAVPPLECPHRRCYELSHLKAVTPKVNKLRSGSLFAVNAAKARCDNGHEFAGDNLIIFADGKRGCRECQRKLGREARERRRGKANATKRAKLAAVHLAREHHCKVCGADIHHRPPNSKFCELCTTDKPVRRAAQLRLAAEARLF